MTTNDKIRSRAAAVAWRKTQPGPVAFTNGVFDLLHPGHVELLERARSEGAVLIVGINSDRSVQSLGKASDRPLLPEAARARLVAALEAVSCVVLFDESTPLELITALEPNVLVKGADYARDQIVGADLVERQGGRVVRVQLVSGYSTTTLVERLRASS